jgi:hypothetical protein
MGREVEYSARERFWLWAVAVFGFVGVNGAFVYALLVRPDALAAAMANPIAAAFMVEALLLVGVLAYLLGRWGVSRLSWVWFVLLSLVGSLACALPVVLLWPRGRDGPGG